MGTDLLVVYREAVECGVLPPSTKEEHITLLHKKGDRVDLANWRQITFLMADYKIMAKLLVLCLRKSMPQVVYTDQTCGVTGRRCSMNLALIRDALAWAEQRGVPLALLSKRRPLIMFRMSSSSHCWRGWALVQVLRSWCDCCMQGR